MSSSRDGGRTVDGTNSRWRLGIAPCLEVLVDIPTYFGNIKAPGSSGFSDVAPAVKWQISPVPGKIDLSMTVGAALPTGALEIAGRGVQPYLQFPWSWELHDGWALNGMFTEFFRPSELTWAKLHSRKGVPLQLSWRYHCGGDFNYLLIEALAEAKLE